MENDLHRVVAGWLTGFFAQRPDFTLLLAPECTGSQRLPLFSTPHKCRETNFCWVDAVLLENETVRAVIEVEQCGIPKPSTLGGKILPIGMSRYLGLPAGCVPLHPELAFIEIVNSERVPDKSKKLLQYANFETSIRELLPLGRVHEYWLLFGKPDAPNALLTDLQGVLEGMCDGQKVCAEVC
jgi:hypothetical protein